MQLRTTHYLTLVLAFVLLAFLLLLTLSLSHMGQMEKGFRSITDKHLKKYELVNAMRDGIRVRQISLRTAILLKKVSDREKEIERFYSYATPVAQARNRLVEMALDDKERVLLERINVAMQARGFDGNWRTINRLTIRGRDWVFAAVSAAFIFGMYIFVKPVLG